MCWKQIESPWYTHFIGDVEKGLQKKELTKNIYRRRELYRIQKFLKAYQDWQMFYVLYLNKLGITKHPYYYKLGDYIVKTEFKEGSSWKETMELVLHRTIKL